MTIPEMPGDEESSEATKRKSPFVKLPADRTSSDGEEESVSGTSPKHFRKHSFDIELPKLLSNECEIVADISEMFYEVNQGEFDDSGQIRIERVSPLSFSGRLKFQLVLFLTRRIDDPAYDLGLFIRCVSPENCTETDYWVYRPVGILVMFLNSKNVSDSRVSQDVCPLSSGDSCRGWLSIVTFTTLSDLASQGFLFGTSKLFVRGQASFDGCESVRRAVQNDHVPAGLENLGATCYLNGLLQSLFHIGKFREIVYRGCDGDSDDILEALQFVFYQLDEAGKLGGAPVGASILTRAFGWDSLDESVQHDAQELNRLLIDRIESRLKVSGRDAHVRELFCGQVENFIQCLDIDYCSKRVESFYDLQLSIMSLDGLSLNHSVEEALQQYLTSEILEGPNMYETPSGSKERAKKGVKFLSLPPVLTLQLMRFQFDFDTCEMAKINKEFVFDSSLDMTPYVGDSEKYIYDLHSVLVHSGGSVSSGHYYSYVRMGESDWIKFDDTLVSHVPEFCAIQANYGGPGESMVVNYLTDTSSDDEEHDRNFSAYMLTYVRRDMAKDLLQVPCLEEVNAELVNKFKTMDQPTVRRTKRQKRISKIVDLTLPDVFSTPVFSKSDIPESWCTTTHVGELYSFHKGKVNKWSEGHQNDSILLSGGGEGKYLMLFFQNDRFFFKGIVPSWVDHIKEVPNVTVYYQEGMVLKLITNTETFVDEGSVIIYSSKDDDPQVYFETIGNTFEIEYIWYNWKTGLEEKREKKISDIRNIFGHENCFVFQSNPFVSDMANPVAPDSSCYSLIIDLINKDTLSLHIVPLPPFAIDKGPPLVVDVYSERILVHVLETDSMAELFNQVKAQLNVHVPLQLVEIDNSQIVNVFKETDRVVVAGLLAWGARNIFKNILRVEESKEDDLWCYHYDKSQHESFGVPFVLPFCEDDLPTLVAEQMGISLGAVRGLKLVKENKHILRIVHPARVRTQMLMKE